MFMGQEKAALLGVSADELDQLIAKATASKVVVQFILDCARVMTALLFLWLVCATLFLPPWV